MPWHLQPSSHPCHVAKMSHLLPGAWDTYTVDVPVCTALSPGALPSAGLAPGLLCATVAAALLQWPLWPSSPFMPPALCWSQLLLHCWAATVLLALPTKSKKQRKTKPFLATSQLSPSRVQGLNSWVISQRHLHLREWGTLSAEGIFQVGWWWENH